MDKLDYILTRIADGARVRVATDYFGQPIVAVPRRWLPGSKRIRLTPNQMDVVHEALMQRKSLRNGASSRRPRALRDATRDRVVTQA
ncbi:MAG: hypothetical protein R3D27_13880 [Hyphomicrobiaceae bacterium]